LSGKEVRDMKNREKKCLRLEETRDIKHLKQDGINKLKEKEKVTYYLLRLPTGNL